MKKLIKSFGYAFSGLWACIIYERNFRIHISAALAVFVFAWLYGVDNVHLAVLVLTVALVFITEAVNTSIEAAVDFLSPERSETAKIAKDAAAGAVLLSAIAAVAVAVMSFNDLDRLGWTFLQLFTMPNLIFTVAYIILSIVFIFCIVPKTNIERK